MAITMNIGQTATLSIKYLDQSGQVMTTTPTPDAPPTWTNADPTVGTLTVATDGNTASDVALVAGTDNIGLSVLAGGKTFSASIAVTVAPPVQILTSVEIEATVA